MPKYDVFKNPGGGLLLDVQSDLLSALESRVVVPLMPASKSLRPAERLNPVFTIDGKPYVMATQWLAAVRTNLLKHRVGNLGSAQTEITNALDVLLTGI